MTQPQQRQTKKQIPRYFDRAKHQIQIIFCVSSVNNHDDERIFVVVVVVNYQSIDGWTNFQFHSNIEESKKFAPFLKRFFFFHFKNLITGSNQPNNNKEKASFCLTSDNHHWIKIKGSFYNNSVIIRICNRRMESDFFLIFVVVAIIHLEHQQHEKSCHFINHYNNRKSNLGLLLRQKKHERFVFCKREKMWVKSIFFFNENRLSWWCNSNFFHLVIWFVHGGDDG